jgi:2,3-bisphosphoglycerate-independent phosphoglycerate mutase
MDGLGDRLVPELKNQTPLQAADTPTFDRLVKEGQTGLMDVLRPGYTPGSDTAHLSLFGYNPMEVYPGRGPFEALGSGMEYNPGEVAFRTNYASVDENLVVFDRRAGRTFTDEETVALQAEIDGLKIDGATIRFLSTVQHRGALVIEGKGLSGKITDTDPHATGVKLLTSKALIPEAEKTAKIANKLTEIAHKKFNALSLNDDRKKRGLPPANALMLRGAGQLTDTESFKQRYGIRSACLAGGALYIGVAKYLGMEHILVEGQTGTIDTNFGNIAKKAIEVIESGYGYLFIHIKATDNASHDHDWKKKMLAIERTDAMVADIIQAAPEKIVIGVTGDHTTPVATGAHTSDPVPVLLWSEFMRPDKVKKFSEIDAMEGALGTIRGLDLTPLLLGYAGHIEKYGA